MNQNITCSICSSAHIFYIDELKPYIDKEWIYTIYECLECNTRFAIEVETENVNYHEIFYKTGNDYEFYYSIADTVKTLLNKNQIKKCENYLKSINYIKYNKIINFISNNKNLEILEIGSSTGFLTAYLRKCGHNAIGLDISKSAVAYSNNNFGNYYYTILPENCKFDLIIHVGTIGCVNKPKEFLNEFTGLLKINGFMYFNSPNLNSVKKENRIWVDTLPPDLIYIFSKKSFELIFESRKFKISFEEMLDYRKYFFLKKQGINKSKNFEKTISGLAKKQKLSNLIFYRVFIGLLKIIIYPLIKTKLITRKYEDYGLYIKVQKL